MLLGIDVQISTRTIKMTRQNYCLQAGQLLWSYLWQLIFWSSLLDITDDPLLENEAANTGYKSTKILHSKYDAVNTVVAAHQQKHSLPSQSQKLAALFAKFIDKLFSGKLGCYSHYKVHLEIKNGAVPYVC